MSWDRDESSYCSYAMQDIYGCDNRCGSCQIKRNYDRGEYKDRHRAAEIEREANRKERKLKTENQDYKKLVEAMRPENC